MITVVSDPNIHRAALASERHSDEVVAKARDMVRDLKERGDKEAADDLVARIRWAGGLGRVA